MSELLAGVLDGLAGLHPAVLYLLAGLFTALETSAGIGLLVPGDGVVLLAGTTATTATTPHRFAALITTTMLGSLAGESVGYLLGRRYGRRPSGPARWAAAEAFLAGRGGRTVAAARFIAMVHALVPVLAGTLGMPYRRLIGWSAVGPVAWSVLYVAVGAAAGASWRQHGDRVGLAGLAVVVAALAVALTVRTARSHAQRRHGAAPPSSPVQPLEPLTVDPLGGGRHERHDTAA